MSGSAGIIASIAKALSAISPASMAVISRAPGRLTPSWKADSNMGARLGRLDGAVQHMPLSKGRSDDPNADSPPRLHPVRGRIQRCNDLAAQPGDGPGRG